MNIRRFFVVAVLALSMASCAARVKTVTNLPTNVTQKQAQDYDAAVASVDRISVVTTSLRTGLIQLNRDGIFPDGPEYAAAVTAVGKVDQLQISAATFLKSTTPDKFDASAKVRLGQYMSQISTEIQNINSAGLTGIKNPNSLNTINNLIGQVTGLVNLVLNL